MRKKDIQEQKDQMYTHLADAYEIAGDLRDEFTDIGENETALKEHCNVIRMRIDELKDLKGRFQSLINKIKE